jgi:hypothetical protein
MELNSDLIEKLLDNNEDKIQEAKDKNIYNRVEYLGNMGDINNNKKFEKIDTVKLEDKKELFINKKDKTRMKTKFGKLINKEAKKKIKMLKPKVINHFLLVIFTIIQVLLILNPIITNLRSQEKVFYNVFLENSSKEVDDYNRVLYLYDINDLRDHFKKTINNFFNLDKFLLNKVSYLRNYTVVEFFYFEDKYINNLNKELFLKNESLLSNNDFNDNSIYNLNDYQEYNDTQEFIINKVTNYKITNERFGPFLLDNKLLKLFLNDVKYFRVHFRFHIFTMDEISGLEKCNEWV